MADWVACVPDVERAMMLGRKLEEFGVFADEPGARVRLILKLGPIVEGGAGLEWRFEAKLGSAGDLEMGAPPPEGTN